MTFERKYTDGQVLDALDTEKARAIIVIMNRVGCSRNTCKALLDKLEYQGKIKKVEIEGLGFGYIKVKM